MPTSRPINIKQHPPSNQGSSVDSGLVNSRATSSWLYRFGGNATAVPAMRGAPGVRESIGSVDVEYVVSAMNLMTKRVPSRIPELANRVRRYTARTATLYRTILTAAPADVRWDLIGKGECG